MMFVLLLVSVSGGFVAVSEVRRANVGAFAAGGKGFATKKKTTPLKVEEDAGAAKREEEIFAKYGVGGSSAPAPAPPAPKKEVRLLDLVPGSVQLGLERFLLGGIVVLLVAFVGIGVGITVDAFATATKQPLSEDQRHLIVDVLEPNFTPTLVAGFACSISLGILKTLQLAGDDVQYAEYAEKEETKKGEEE